MYEFVNLQQQNGWQVESYIIPFIWEERSVGSTVFQRTSGIIDVSNVNLEIPMLYSSIFPDGIGYLSSYANQSQTKAIGEIYLTNRYQV